MSLPRLTTDRLILRPWKEDDLPLFAQINADPQVMEFYEKTLTREESDALARKFQEQIIKNGYGFWAVEVIGGPQFIGYVGLNYWNLEAPFAPCVDIGWRLARSSWGHGYATEAARKVLEYGFETLKLSEIVAMATVHNLRSQRVMEKLGMRHNPKENFHHPKLPIAHRFSFRVLYRISSQEWLSNCAMASKEPPN